VRRTATMTSKGQVTIPVDVRRRLGLKQGDRIAFEVAEGAATLRPVAIEPDPFMRYAGALATLADETAVAAWLRDLRDDDE
jgi:antitoxin PrlF